MPDFTSFPLRHLTGTRRPFGEANTSLWMDTIRDAKPLPRSQPVPATCDVAIIGAGLTGLWTAYYLKRANPSVNVAIYEANHVAFGASGRAGGWIIGTLDGQEKHLASLDPLARREVAALVANSVDEVGNVVQQHGIECGYRKSGVLRIAARHSSQLNILEKYRETIAAEQGEDIAQMLDAEEASAIAPFRAAMAGLRLDYCAVVNPAQLALGLAHVLIELGVKIYENCAVNAVRPGLIETESGNCHAAVVVPAVEGYGCLLQPLARHIIAPYSHIIATAPLSASVRNSIGLDNREAFADCSRMSTYGQITADGRVVFGATGSYPRWGVLGSFQTRFISDRYSLVHRTLLDLIPQLQDTEITHAWSGALGASRDFKPLIVEDKAKGLIWGGGYIGRGLAAANLFGQTIAELATGLSTVRTGAPWVRPNACLVDAMAKWEPEPLRTIGAKLSTLPGELVERAYLSSMPSPAKAIVSLAARCIPRAR